MAGSYSHSASDISADIAKVKTILIVVVAGLTLLGCVMVYSAAAPSAISENADPLSYLRDQVIFVILGCALAFVLWRVVPYQVWRGNAALLFWALGVVLLLLTAVAGTAALGAKRWLVLGPFSFQPSEFVKIIIVVMAARLLSDFNSGRLTPSQLLWQAVIFLLVPVAILYRTQSDLGTTAIIAIGILAVMVLGDVDKKVIALIVGGLVVFGIASIVGTGYRSDRMVYLDPWNDGENGHGNGYQIIHSYYAFSEGGLFGVGLGNSREKFLYLPESETDFIYSVIGEELGLVGALVVLAAFMVVLWAGMRIASAAFDDFGAMVAGGLTVMLVFQAFLNMGCAIGVLPTTGKPLPFVSSGGSSVIASLMMVGLVLSVAEEAESPSVYERRREDLRVVRVNREGSFGATGERQTARGSVGSRDYGRAQGAGRGAGRSYGSPARRADRRGGAAYGTRGGFEAARGGRRR